SAFRSRPTTSNAWVSSGGDRGGVRGAPVFDPPGRPGRRGLRPATHGIENQAPGSAAELSPNKANFAPAAEPDPPDESAQVAMDQGVADVAIEKSVAVRFGEVAPKFANLDPSRRIRGGS